VNPPPRVLCSAREMRAYLPPCTHNCPSEARELAPSSLVVGLCAETGRDKSARQRERRQQVGRGREVAYRKDKSSLALHVASLRSPSADSQNELTASLFTSRLWFFGLLCAPVPSGRGRPLVGTHARAHTHTHARDEGTGLVAARTKGEQNHGIETEQWRGRATPPTFSPPFAVEGEESGIRHTLNGDYAKPSRLISCYGKPWMNSSEVFFPGFFLRRADALQIRRAPRDGQPALGRRPAAGGRRTDLLPKSTAGVEWR